MTMATSGDAATPREIARFIVVGGLSTALYVVLTTALTHANIALVEASFVSYLVCSVFAFFGHRVFVFGSQGFWAAEAARFAALNSAGLVTTAIAPAILTDRLGLAPIYAIGATCVIAPAINYLAMRSLVFRRVRREALSPAMLQNPTVIDRERRRTQWDRQKTLRLLSYVLIASIAVGVVHLCRLWAVDPNGLSSISRKLPEWDYANMWFGGRLAMAGQVSTLFDLEGYRDFVASIAPHMLDSSEWSYPPNILLIAVPLATLSLISSYVVWTIGALGLLAGVLRRAALPPALIVAVVASPASFMNVLFGQNGALSAALLCGGLLLLESNSILAGIFFGLLTIKPHLGLMVPICLLAGRRWPALLSASIVTVAQILLSGLCFGWDSWISFFSRTVPMMRGILELPYPQPYQINSVSFFIFLRSIGLGSDGAWIGQGIATVLVSLAVWRVWSDHRANQKLRVALTIIATFVATPYAYIYDLVSFSVALVLMGSALLDDDRVNASQKNIGLAMMVFFWLWPQLQEPVVAHLSYQVSAIVIVLAFGLSLGLLRTLRTPLQEIRFTAQDDSEVAQSNAALLRVR